MGWDGGGVAALSLFIFAESRGELRRYVAALRAWEVRNPHARSVTGNFLSLLRCAQTDDSDT